MQIEMQNSPLLSSWINCVLYHAFVEQIFAIPGFWKSLNCGSRWHPLIKGFCYLSHTPQQLMNHLESFWVASLMSLSQHWGEGITRCPYTGHSVKYGQYTRDALWVKDNLHCLQSVCKEWTAPPQSATNTDLLKKNMLLLTIITFSLWRGGFLCCQ